MVVVYSMSYEISIFIQPLFEFIKLFLVPRRNLKIFDRQKNVVNHQNEQLIYGNKPPSWLRVPQYRFLSMSCHDFIHSRYVYVFFVRKKNDEKWIIFDLSLCAILLLYGKRKSYGNDSTHTF